jgi:hypothetical protein
MITATTFVDDLRLSAGSATATAKVGSLTVSVPGRLLLVASKVSTRAFASCGAQRGAASFGSLTINGRTISVRKLKANSVVLLPGGGRVVLDHPARGRHAITFQAVHVVIPGVIDTAFATAQAAAAGC